MSAVKSRIFCASSGESLAISLRSGTGASGTDARGRSFRDTERELLERDGGGADDSSSERTTPRRRDILVLVLSVCRCGGATRIGNLFDDVSDLSKGK
jgi:hypothetical protein